MTSKELEAARKIQGQAFNHALSKGMSERAAFYFAGLVQQEWLDAGAKGPIKASMAVEAKKETLRHFPNGGDPAEPYKTAFGKAYEAKKKRR